MLWFTEVDPDILKSEVHFHQMVDIKDVVIFHVQYMDALCIDLLERSAVSDQVDAEI